MFSLLLWGFMPIQESFEILKLQDFIQIIFTDPGVGQLSLILTVKHLFNFVVLAFVWQG